MLLETYFSSDAQPLLVAQTALNIQSFVYGQELVEKARRQIQEAYAVKSEVQQQVRDQGFRKAIVRIYQHRCAFCGVRLITVDGHSVVEAAHIVPWSIDHNDDLHKGIALCRLCHWWVTAEGYLSARSYRLRAISRGDNQLNRTRTPLSSSLAAGTTATLKARVRWLRGHPEILLRLRGNWLEAAGTMTLPTNLGTPGAAGPLVTAGGLVFIGYSLDDTFRAFDLHTGEILWEADLPAAGTAVPVSYEVNGEQYVVIPAGGHSMYGSTMGDSVLAYRLGR